MKSAGIYLTFDGNCADAFAHYSKVFQKKLKTSMTNGNSPMKDKLPKEVHDKIMHCSLDIGMGDKFGLMGSDRNPIMHTDEFKLGNNTQITLTPSSKKETERLFQELSEGGKVLMPLAPQFWGSIFGSLIDKFGIQWMFDIANEETNNDGEEKKEGEHADHNKHKLDDATEPDAKEAKTSLHSLAKETIPAKTCVGLLHKGAYNKIGETFGKFFGDLKKDNGKKEENKEDDTKKESSGSCSGASTMDGKVLGLYLDNPECTKEEDLRSYAAMEISGADSEKKYPANWEKVEVGGGPAAVLTVNGSYSQLPDAWKSFGGRVAEKGWKFSSKKDHISQEVYVDMDMKDDSKNVTKLIMFLEE